MRIDAHNGGGHSWKVIDPATGGLIRDIVWADDVTRQFGQLRRDAAGRIQHDGTNVIVDTTKARAIHIDVTARTVKIYKVA